MAVLARLRVCAGNGEAGAERWGGEVMSEIVMDFIDHGRVLELIPGKLGRHCGIWLLAAGR